MALTLRNDYATTVVNKKMHTRETIDDRGWYKYRKKQEEEFLIASPRALLRGLQVAE